MRGKTFIDEYVDAILTEFDSVTRHLDKTRLVSQVHWGGGTPNSISMKYIGRVMEKISSNFKFTANCEIAMECNPAYLTFKQVDELVALGFNRLSIGIQDFSPEVLKIINRKPSLLNEEELTGYITSKNVQVNLDFVYGLPGQTPESFEQTMIRALKIAPQRIVTFSYAHVPWVKSAQKELEKYGLPDAQLKLAMFENANRILKEAGYVSIGLDHFAKPGDELAKALQQHQLHRNFMGYCSRENTGQVYAFGATSISQMWDCFSQNIKKPEEYIKAIRSTGTAIERGYAMTSTDMLCNAVIQEIMCNQYVDLAKVADDFSISLRELVEKLQFKEQNLETFIDDGLITYNNYILNILPQGKYFLRNIAMVFDPLLTGKETNYSKTL
jgi:oxygen-independent coproporphyrinogen-3 oxidase